MTKVENTATCKTCNGLVSKKAKLCPHCGEKKPYKAASKPADSKKIIKYSAIGFILMLPMVFAQEQNTHSYQSNAQTDFSKLRTLCHDAIRGSVKNPSTLDIKYLSGYAADTLPDGTQRMVQTFSAKNSFGLELTSDAKCLIKPDGSFEFIVVEQGR